MDSRKLILDHWESYLETTLNHVYVGEEFRMLLSDNLSGAQYNQVYPESMDADLSRLRDMDFIEHIPSLHGEKNFIDNFRSRRFPDTSRVRKEAWMKFEAGKPKKQEFDAEFRWIEKQEIGDYLSVKKKAFNAPESYINLHDPPERVFGEDFMRLVCYSSGQSISAGEIRFGRWRLHLYAFHR
ncbi:MAG: hypothetical protein ABEJ56_01845 [Candidatus Nanohaloarchaea archaeon]